MEQRAAKSEALAHSPRVRRDPLRPSVPETEALEQHPDPLPSLGHVVEATEQIQVLERGELSIHERLVREKAHPPTVDLDLDASRAWVQPDP